MFYKSIVFLFLFSSVFAGYIGDPKPYGQGTTVINVIEYFQINKGRFGYDTNWNWDLKPESVLDWSPIVQGAIDDIPSSGGTVYFPVGNYNFRSSILIPGILNKPSDGCMGKIIKLIGESGFLGGSTGNSVIIATNFQTDVTNPTFPFIILNMDGSGNQIVSCPNVFAVYSFWEIKKIAFFGSRSRGQQAIVGKGVSEAIIEDCFFHDFFPDTRESSPSVQHRNAVIDFSGNNVSYNENLSFKRLRFDNAKNGGCISTGSCNDNMIIENCYSITDTSTPVFSDYFLYSMGGAGITIRDGIINNVGKLVDAHNVNNICIENLHTEGHVFYVAGDNNRNITIRNCYIQGLGVESVSYLINDESRGTYNVNICNNHLNTQGQPVPDDLWMYGMPFNQIHNIVFSGNVITDNCDPIKNIIPLPSTINPLITVLNADEIKVQNKLQVTGASNTLALIQTRGNEEVSLDIQRNQQGGTYNNTWTFYMPPSSKDLRLWKQYDGSSDVVTFGANGCVGIGNISPQKALDITTPQGSAEGIRILYGQDNSYYMILGVDNIQVKKNNFFLSQTGDQGIGLQTGGLPRLYVHNNGNVGIGTGITVPGAKLEVNGDIKATSANIGNTTVSGLTSTGNIQSTSANITGALTAGTTTVSSLTSSSNIVAPTLVSATGTSLSLGSNNTPNQVVIKNGNVGIGISTPASKLDISGSAGIKVKKVTGSYTAADEAVILVNIGSATITLPIANTVTNRTYYIKKISNATGTITINGNGSTIDGSTSKTLTTQYQGMQIVCDGSAWFIVALK